MEKYRIFFGTYSKGQGNGVFQGEFDTENGEICLNGNTVDIENPSYLQLSGNILYGVSEVSEFENENGGALFSIDISDISKPAKMKQLSIESTHGKHPCHLWIKDNLIFVSNYSEGSLSIFETDDSGNIKPSCRSIHHFGKSVNEGRQKQSHVHFAAVTPDNQYLAVCDLGMDRVFLYPYSSDSKAKGNGLVTDAEIIDCPPGAGPRHLTFSNNGKYMYVLTELTNTILVYEYNGGDVTFLQEIPTLPSGFTAGTSAAIHISPDGKLLASSNRGHDSLAVFEIQSNGELAFLTHIMTGKEPRDFSFSPDGKWILAGNQNGDSVTVYKIENNTFRKINETSETKLPKPVCIVFGGKI